jgi:3-hydroxyacyl-CoA dehydrogenase
MHFFSPANVMRLLEVVRGAKTTAPTRHRHRHEARQEDRQGRRAGRASAPASSATACSFQRQNQAQRMLVLEGAMPWDVDRVLYDFGLPMGPFAMSDLAGLDIGWNKETSKGETMRDQLCEMDRRGQKTGAGYYDYDENRNAKASPVTEKIILDFAAKQGLNQRDDQRRGNPRADIFPMINEGAKILEEGKAIRASDIDIVWINGYGWPVYRGGPMFYADLVGLPKVLERLKQYQNEMGDFFKPSALLEKLVAEGKGFKDLK